MLRNTCFDACSNLFRHETFFKDMKLEKNGRFETITGEVIKYRKVVHGGDPDTISYYPTIRDIDKEWVVVEVKADNTEINKTYHCVYLPNTKIAVCEIVDTDSSTQL